MTPPVQITPPPVTPPPVTPIATPLDPIDAFLAKRICHDSNCTCVYHDGDSSPLTGKASSFAANGAIYGVDDRLIVAIAGQETNFGFRTACTLTHNAFNWFWCYADSAGCHNDPVRNSPFATWEYGIGTVTKFMRKSYLQKGYTTVAQIGGKYCTSGCSGWVYGVTAFLQQFGGDPGRLEIPPAPP